MSGRKLSDDQKAIERLSRHIIGGDKQIAVDKAAGDKDEDYSTLDTLGYNLIAKPLYKVGEKLSGESTEQSVKRYEQGAADIDSGKTFVKNSSTLRRRIKELKGNK